jgi:hypothetical protein
MLGIITIIIAHVKEALWYEASRPQTSLLMCISRGPVYLGI